MTQANSSKKLLKNIGFLSISQFSTKILTFFLVPLYTSILSTEDYGVYDFIVTTIGLLMPILTLYIVEAVLRYSLDKKESSEKVFSNGLSVVFIAIIAALCLLLINIQFTLVPQIDKYALFFGGVFVTELLSQLLSNFSRGIDRVLDISVAGIISAIVVICSNILFLVVLKMGLNGYFYATILGNCSTIIYLSIRLKVWNYINISEVEKPFIYKMIGYSAPLIINQISWWINNASDRYIVIGICGIAANGIYSIGYKIPTILNTFQSIFNSSWVLSTVQEYDKNDTKGFFSSIFNKYNCIMVIVCSIIIFATRIIAQILYAKEFYSAWEYVPFLTEAVAFGALSGYLGGIFTAVKNTKIISLSTAFGALVNIVLNLLLVKMMGPMGAAIATLISSITIFVVRSIWIKKYIVLRISTLKLVAVYIILTAQASLMVCIFDNKVLNYIVQLICFALLVYFLKAELHSLISSVFRRKKNYR